MPATDLQIIAMWKQLLHQQRQQPVAAINNKSISLDHWPCMVMDLMRLPFVITTKQQALSLLKRRFCNSWQHSLALLWRVHWGVPAQQVDMSHKIQHRKTMPPLSKVDKCTVVLISHVRFTSKGNKSLRQRTLTERLSLNTDLDLILKRWCTESLFFFAQSNLNAALEKRLKINPIAVHLLN